jgi:hypothetical protein
MRAASKVARLFGRDEVKVELPRRSIADDIAELERALAEVRASGAAACSRIDELEALRQEATTYAESKASDAQLEEARWNQRHAAAELPKIEARLAAAKDAWRRSRVAYHQANLKSEWPRLQRAINEAVVAQEAVQAAYDEACRDIGGLAQTYVPNPIYNGFLRRDFVAIWLQHNERLFAGTMPKPPELMRASAPLAPSPPRPASPSPPVIVRKPPVDSLQHPVRADEVQHNPPQRPRRPDDLLALQPGEVRARVLRPGYPDTSGQQCDGQQVIRLPEATAAAALKAGAIEIIETAGDAPAATSDDGRQL